MAIKFLAVLFIQKSYSVIGLRCVKFIAFAFNDFHTNSKGWQFHIKSLCHKQLHLQATICLQKKRRILSFVIQRIAMKVSYNFNLELFV